MQISKLEKHLAWIDACKGYQEERKTAAMGKSPHSGDLLSVHLSYGNSYLRRDNFKACIVFVIIISSWLEQSSKRLLISAL